MKVLGAAAIVIAGLGSAAWGTEQPGAVQIVDRWDRCFLASTRSQFLKNIEAEPNMVAEVAFSACSTEEMSLRNYLELGHMPPANAEAIILRHRAIMKGKITG